MANWSNARLSTDSQPSHTDPVSMGFFTIMLGHTVLRHSFSSLATLRVKSAAQSGSSTDDRSSRKLQLNVDAIADRDDGSSGIGSLRPERICQKGQQRLACSHRTDSLGRAYLAVASPRERAGVMHSFESGLPAGANCSRKSVNQSTRESRRCCLVSWQPEVYPWQPPYSR
jgi:hypothetical protein